MTSSIAPAPVNWLRIHRFLSLMRNLLAHGAKWVLREVPMQMGASVCKRAGGLALLVLVLISQWFAILPAWAEIAPVTESETRACGFNNYSGSIDDCSSYESVFNRVDAFCKEWLYMEAYLVQCATLLCTYRATAASAALARVTLARMSEALAVQMNGFGWAL